MGIALDEQETIVNIRRSDERASVYTSDTRYMNKLDKLTAISGDWELDEVFRDSTTHEVNAKSYTCPVSLISFRSKVKTMSEEQRKAAADRMKAAREK